MWLTLLGETVDFKHYAKIWTSWKKCHFNDFGWKGQWKRKTHLCYGNIAFWSILCGRELIINVHIGIIININTLRLQNRCRDNLWSTAIFLFFQTVYVLWPLDWGHSVGNHKRSRIKTHNLLNQSCPNSTVSSQNVVEYELRLSLTVNVASFSGIQSSQWFPHSEQLEITSDFPCFWLIRLCKRSVFWSQHLSSIHDAWRNIMFCVDVNVMHFKKIWNQTQRLYH